jgi:hypothetical protein
MGTEKDIATTSGNDCTCDTETVHSRSCVYSSKFPNLILVLQE